LNAPRTPVRPRERAPEEPVEDIRRHTIGLLVENHPGVLARIAALIAAKNYNIESLCVAATHDETLSSMTLVVLGDDWVVEQACKQLNRLIDVVKVKDLTGESTVERELLLMRVHAPTETRAEVLRLADVFRARVIDIGPVACTFELTGSADKVDAFIEMLKPYQIQELHRTGRVVMQRAARANGRSR
jgi:acetolactate synthase I/III small subunit